MSIESPRRDRSRWFVPIVVATIAAVATVLAAAIPFLLSHRQGTANAGGDGTGGPPRVLSTGLVPGTHPNGRGTPAPGNGGTVDHSNFYVLFSGAVLGSHDLDGGGQAAGDKIPDIQVLGTALAATVNSRIALLPSANYDVGICRAALTERGTDSVPADKVQTGSVVCVKTTKGMIGVIILEVVRHYNGELNQINYNYIIWTDRL